METNKCENPVDLLPVFLYNVGAKRKPSDSVGGIWFSWLLNEHASDDSQTESAKHGHVSYNQANESPAKQDVEHEVRIRECQMGRTCV